MNSYRNCTDTVLIDVVLHQSVCRSDINNFKIAHSISSVVDNMELYSIKNDMNNS